MSILKQVPLAVLLSLSVAANAGAADFFADHKTDNSQEKQAMDAARRPADLDDMIAETVPKFKQETYTDAVTGKTITYNIFLPQGYDGSKSYPLVLFIADASTPGKAVTAPLTQGYGGIIWATPEEQAKHPAIVVVPQYPEVILDDHGQHVLTDYVEATGRMLKDIETTYHVDTQHIYGTGQSMGCMTVMYLAAQHPDLFTATLLVDGQWDIQALEGLKSQKFIYVAAGGDDKASAGQAEVEQMMKHAGIGYSKLTNMDAKENALVRNTEASLVLDKGFDKNFFSWKTGSVLPDNASAKASEHMFSFNPAYDMEAFRDWLFKQ